ncbi:MAG TPA: SOS response-associated peptidase [Thermoanaerobaculia bacterium]|nr:SOS response-associated peptidase [Thermoanaerobaculia bacterium]HUM30191.1 SOS response-associated peptidase [Thermoanaerobaculia bacterium]HXK68360.1 SOS response-associated peptidase [Thermoanaerobaculia bacterium]
MCGRFVQISVSDSFIPGLPDSLASNGLAPNYNVAPTQDISVWTMEDGRLTHRRMRWGLIPSWAEDASIGNRMINARAETAADKPGFRSAMRHRRCIIPADGFYEWVDRPGGRVPIFIHRIDGSPLLMAGLWESWSSPEGDPILSCTILTVEANAFMKPFHHRMPVLLHRNDGARWLDPSITEPGMVLDLLRPLAEEALTAHEVSRRVNSPKNNSHLCIQPVPGGLTL